MPRKFVRSSPTLTDWTGERVPVQESHGGFANHPNRRRLTGNAHGGAQDGKVENGRCRRFSPLSAHQTVPCPLLQPCEQKSCMAHHFVSSYSHPLTLLRNFSMPVAMDKEKDTHPMSGSGCGGCVLLFKPCNLMIFLKHGVENFP